MKDLTQQETQTLLTKVKSFLNISWYDQDTDTKVLELINSSIRSIDEVAGVELNYLIEPSKEIKTTDLNKLYNTMSYLGQELLQNRVFYLREKALDDFEGNYRQNLVALYSMGKVYKSKVNSNAQQ